jgi:S1-C subfamily serine protease
MALIPPHALDCIVAIGTGDIATNASPGEWIASGFLYGKLVEPGDLEEDLPSGSRQYLLYLITNRHVFDGLDTLYLRFNRAVDPSAIVHKANARLADGSPIWFAHPNPDVDLAMLALDPNILSRAGVQFSMFQSDVHTADRATAVARGITEGDGIYVLGFPLGIVGKPRSYPIVRHGIVARIRDWLGGHLSEFLIDAAASPGNSGGPVITQPTAFAISGTRPQRSSLLLGVTSGAVSVNNEPSGLTIVVPVDYVNEMITDYLIHSRTPRPPSTPLPPVRLDVIP